MGKGIASLLAALVGGPLGSDTYTLLQFHFHWGSDNSKGSEHFLNGKQYSAEVRALVSIAAQQRRIYL